MSVSPIKKTFHPRLLPPSVAWIALFATLLFTSGSLPRLVSGTFVGTYDHRFLAFEHLNLTELQQVPTSVAPDQAFYIHEFEPLPESAGFFPVPVMMAPICIAYNASNLVGAGALTFDISLETLGQWMMGTLSNFNTSLSDHSLHAPIGTAQFRLVLAQDSPTTRTVLHRMIEEGVEGFTSAFSLPPQVLANPNITWVSDEFAAIDMMHNGDGSTTHGLVTFISVCHGALLPCASVIVPTNGGRETRITTPMNFAKSDKNLFSIIGGTYNYSYDSGTTNAANIAIYPLFGTIFMSYPVDPSCGDGPRSDVVIEFLEHLYTDDVVFFARLKRWGMLTANADGRLDILREVIAALPCTTAVVYPSGGAWAPDLVIPAWVMKYYVTSKVLIGYEPTDPLDALQGVTDHTYPIGGLYETVFDPLDPPDDPQEAALAQNPNLRLFPIAAMAVSIIYNIPGINSLTLPLCSLLAVLNGTITRWSDPILQKYNPEAALPDADIVITVQTTDDGTTEYFTNGLREIDRRCNFQRTGEYYSDIERTSEWNFKVDLPQTSENDVLAAIRSTLYSIAIVAAPQAATDPNIAQSWLINETTSALYYPSQSLVEETLAVIELVDAATAVIDKTHEFDSANGYPFVGLNYMIFEDNQPAENCSKMRAGFEFLMWALTSPEGQAVSIAQGFVPLPEHLMRNGRQKLIDAKCGGLYVFPQLRTNTSSFELSEGAIAGITVGFFVLVAILIAIFFLICLRGKKSSKHAAKDSSVPMALIFTDIQSSTALWSVAPQAMAASLDLHNEIIDRNIDKYSAYKVKTIGDAFMICVKDIKNAHELCLAIQRDLYSAEWPSEEIGIAYTEILQDQQSPYQKYNLDGTEIYDLADFTDQKRNIETPLYKNRMNERLFRGLAVRIGMTWGCAEPREDPVTGSYDYMGSAVNEASRCESAGNGGQVIYSASAVSALRDAGVDLTDTNRLAVTSLGKQQLKGIPAPVELYQVLPAEFAGRRFPPLRLDNDGSAMNLQLEEENFNRTIDSNTPFSKTDATKNSATMSGTAKSDNNNTAKYVDSSNVSSTDTVDSSLGEDSDSKVPADFRFARYLAKLDRQQPNVYLIIFDSLVCAHAATARQDKRMDAIKNIVTDWRIADISTKHHLYFKKELGYEPYWMMRIAQKISGAVRIKQQKRDPDGDLRCRLTLKSGTATPDREAHDTLSNHHQQQQRPNIARAHSLVAFTSSQNKNPTDVVISNVASVRSGVFSSIDVASIANPTHPLNSSTDGSNNNNNNNNNYSSPPPQLLQYSLNNNRRGSSHMSPRKVASRNSMNANSNNLSSHNSEVADFVNPDLDQQVMIFPHHPTAVFTPRQNQEICGVVTAKQ